MPPTSGTSFYTGHLHIRLFCRRPKTYNVTPYQLPLPLTYVYLVNMMHMKPVLVQNTCTLSLSLHDNENLSSRFLRMLQPSSNDT